MLTRSLAKENKELRRTLAKRANDVAKLRASLARANDALQATARAPAELEFELVQIVAEREALANVAHRALSNRKKMAKQAHKKDFAIGRLAERLASARRDAATTVGLSRQAITEAAQHLVDQTRAHKACVFFLRSRVNFSLHVRACCRGFI
jgi:predicted  nucleic acid-binding Zn-ribbon protein